MVGRRARRDGGVEAGEPGFRRAFGRGDRGRSLPLRRGDKAAIGVNKHDYVEETVFGRLKETRLDHKLEVAYGNTRRID